MLGRPVETRSGNQFERESRVNQPGFAVFALIQGPWIPLEEGSGGLRSVSVLIARMTQFGPKEDN